MPHTTGSIECILLWQRQLKRTFAETVRKFLPCIFGHFQVQCGYPRYQRCSLFRLYQQVSWLRPEQGKFVLNWAKPAWLSLPELCYFTTQSGHFLIRSFSRNHKMVFVHARVGVKGCARYSCAISRSRKCIAQSRDSENAQRNLEIAQILRLRGTEIRWQLRSVKAVPNVLRVTRKYAKVLQ